MIYDVSSEYVVELWCMYLSYHKELFFKVHHPLPEEGVLVRFSTKEVSKHHSTIQGATFL